MLGRLDTFPNRQLDFGVDGSRLWSEHPALVIKTEENQEETFESKLMIEGVMVYA
jgi:hypothetical protein